MRRHGRHGAETRMNAGFHYAKSAIFDAQLETLHMAKSERVGQLEDQLKARDQRISELHIDVDELRDSGSPV